MKQCLTSLSLWNNAILQIDFEQDLVLKEKIWGI